MTMNRGLPQTRRISRFGSAMIIGMIVTCLVLLSTGEQAKGAGLKSLPAGAPLEHNLLKSCPSRHPDVVEARQMVSAWLEIVNSIDECDLDSFFYYNDDRLVESVRMPLQRLRSIANGNCGAQVGRLDGLIESVNAELNHWTPVFLRMCRITDSLADLKLQRQRLDAKIALICDKIAAADIGGRCR